MTTKRIRNDLLGGDGPGATEVTVSIKDRSAVLPLALLLNVLTTAAVRAQEGLDEVEKQPAGPLLKDSVALRNAQESMRYWREDILSTITELESVLKTR